MLKCLSLIGYLGMVGGLILLAGDVSHPVLTPGQQDLTVTHKKKKKNNNNQRGPCWCRRNRRGPRLGWIEGTARGLKVGVSSFSSIASTFESPILVL